MRSQVTYSQGIWIYQHQSCGIFVIVNCQLRIPQLFQSLLMTSFNRSGGILVSWWNLSIETISRENLNYFTELMPLVLGVALSIIDTLNTETDPPVDPDRDWKRIRFYPNSWEARRIIENDLTASNLQHSWLLIFADFPLRCCVVIFI